MPDADEPVQSRSAGGLRGFHALPVLGAILAVALVLSLFRLGYQSYWDDEISTLYFCRAPLLQRIIGVAVLDVSPPLYYVLLGAWERVSEAEAWNRLLSILFHLAAIPLAYGVGRRTVGRGAALTGCLLLSTLPLAVYCAQEVRGYSLLHFLTVALALGLLRQMERPGRRRVAAVALLGAAACYTHYAGLFVLAGFFTWAAWGWRRAKGERLRAVRGAVLGLVLAGVLWLPWVPAFLVQLHGGQGWRPMPGVPEILARLLVYFTAGHTPRRLPVLAGDPQHAMIWLCLLALPFAVLLLAGLSPGRGRALSRDAAEPAPGQGLLACWLLVPVALTLLVSRITPIFSERAALCFYVPAAMLAGAGTVRIWRRSRAAAVILVAGLIVLSLASLRLYYFDPGYEKQNWRALAERIASRAGPRDVVLFHSRSRDLGFRYYNRDRVPITDVLNWPPHEVLSPAERDERIRQIIRDLEGQCDRIWYVDYHAVAFDRAGLLERLLRERFALLEESSHYEEEYRFRVLLFSRSPSEK